MQPTLLKSIFVAWRNTRTMIKFKRYMESRRKQHSERWMAERVEGRRVMEIGSEWALKVLGGHF